MKYVQFVPDGIMDCEVSGWLQPELTESPTRRHPVVVICPGGAYEFVSDREGEPVAKKFYAAGYSTFILKYSVMDKAKDFAPLTQLAASVAYLRENADSLNIDPARIAVCGFSAGGHLAASLGVLHNDEHFLKTFTSTASIRPDAMILGYPVITADRFSHKPSLRHVSGNALEGTEEYGYWGLETHVDAQTPPAFLWHTATDTNVPVENSLKMASALSAAKVPFELHVFPAGGHGMSVCNQEVNASDSYNARWVEWSIQWLNKTLSFTE